MVEVFFDKDFYMRPKNINANNFSIFKHSRRIGMPHKPLRRRSAFCMNLKNWARLCVMAISALFISAGQVFALTDGDIAFTRINGDNPDSFSFVALADIAESTSIYFSNEFWDGASFSNNWHTILFTTTGTINAGNEVHINTDLMTVSFTSGSGLASVSSVGKTDPSEGSAPGYGNFVYATGDNIMAFQGSIASPIFIAAISSSTGEKDTPGNAWQLDIKQANSQLPSRKKNGQDGYLGLFPSGAEQPAVDNARYKSSARHSGDKATVLAALMDLDNWEFDNGTSFSAPTTAFTVTGGNAPPTISISDSTLAYTENNPATQIDAGGTISDTDGDADWNGGTLKIQITANAEAADQISISDTDGDSLAVTISETDILLNGADIGDLSTNGGIATGGTPLTLTFNANATNVIVQEVLQSLRYRTTSEDPGTSNRTITFTATDKNAATASDTRTVKVNKVNDTPTIPTNRVLNLKEAEGAILSADLHLRASDVDDDDATLVFTMTTNTENGALIKSGITLPQDGTFTQADLTAGNITYVHDGTNTASDRFVFKVSDDKNVLTNQTFPIHVTTYTRVALLDRPATDSTDNSNLSIDFSLPEGALTGTVKMIFTQTGGAADGNSPHILTFATGFETAAQHTTILNGGDLSSNANVASVTTDGRDALVDGAIYTVKLAYQDAIGNAASSTVSTGLTYDTRTQPPTLALPAAGSRDNESLSIDFTLPEAARAGTAKMTFTRTGGTADTHAPHILTFTTGFESAAQHTTTLDGTNLSSNAAISNVSSGANDALVDGAIYSVKLEYQDKFGNSASLVNHHNFAYDLTTQTPTLSSPASSSSDNTSLSTDFTLPEAASPGTAKMTFTRTGGDADANSPHVLTFGAGFETAARHTTDLNGADLSSNANVTSVSTDGNDALVDGAIYCVKLEYVDTLGNPTVSVTNTQFTYAFESLPTVTTQAVSSISTTTATGNGNIQNVGIPNPTQHGVCWSTSPSPTLSDSKTETGAVASTGAFTASLTRLTPGATYHVRAYATNTMGTTYGSSVSFTTQTTPTIQASHVECTGLTPSQMNVRWTRGNGSACVVFMKQSPGSTTVPPNNTSFVARSALGAGTQLGSTGWYCVYKGTGNTVTVTGLNEATTYLAFVCEYNGSAGSEAYKTTVSATNPGNASTLVPPAEWIGAGTDARWSNPDNWKGGRCPGPTEAFELSGDMDINLDQDVTLAGLTMQPGFSGTVTQGDGILTINGDFVWSGGSFTGGTKNIDINGSFIQTGGTFTATSAELQVSCDFRRNGGTFHHHEGTVVLNGTDQQITGETRFHTLTKAVTTASSLTFEAGKTQTIEGKFRLNGHKGEPLTLQSSIAGQRWFIHPQADQADTSLVCVNIRDCENIGENPIACGNSDNSGNNDRINFATLEPPRATLANAPTGTTSTLSSRIRVGGIGVTHYKYCIKDNPWSNKTPADTPIEATLDATYEGGVRLYVLGQDAYGFWQKDTEATRVAWTLDLTAPATVALTNAPAGKVGTTTARITVGGTDVSVYKYKLDGEDYGTVYPATKPITLSGLAEWEHTLTVLGGDAHGNMQEAATPEGIVTWTVETAVPTATLNKRPDILTQDTFASFEVTGADSEHGIDAYSYTLDSGAWATGTAGEPITLSGLTDGSHTLHVNAQNDGVWQGGGTGQSTNSATSWTWTVDTQVLPIHHFFAVVKPSSSTSVTLSWWVAEAYAKYRIWYSEKEITPETVDNATELFTTLTTLTSSSTDSVETYTVTGLTPGQPTYFAVACEDRAGNESKPVYLDSYANPVTATPVDGRPEITTIGLTAGGMTGNNAKAREIKIKGTHFLGTEGSNTVCFENARTAFHVPADFGTTTQITVLVPTGAPVGVYNVRVINKNGVSAVAEATYTVKKAPTPMPVVTALSPVIIPTGVTTTVTVSGDNFGEGTVAVNLLGPDGTVTALGGVLTDNSSSLTVDVDTTPTFPEGQYIVQVITADGRKNGISAVKLELCRPVDLSAESGALTTTRAVKPIPGEGRMPVEATLTTDNRDEVDSVNAYRAEISVTFDAGTILETQNIGDVWENYDGLINPPRQIPLSLAVERDLGTDSVLFNLGAEGLIRLKNGATLFAQVDVTLPADVTVPSIYYVAPDGSITLAGIDGIRNGNEINQGGTVLATRSDVPEAGLVTYTVGLLMDHMSTYAAGTKKTNDTGGIASKGSGGGGFGPCFIGSSQQGNPNVILRLLLCGLFTFAGSALFKRLFPILGIVAAIFILGHPSIGFAEETPGVQATSISVSETQNETPWSIKLGLGFGFIGEEYRASAGGARYDLEMDNVISPMIRVGYRLSRDWSMEVKASMDLYSGNMDVLATNGSSSINGYTLGAGPVWYLKEHQSNLVGTWRPFVHGGINYKKLKGNLAFPVHNFHSALGMDFGVGVECGQMDIRLGYTWAVFDESGTATDYSAAESNDDLGLSGVVLEVAWSLPFNG